MKSISGLAILLSLFATGFGQSRNTGTIEKLKLAYAAEFAASAKYAAYSGAAHEENLTNIAKLFQATSKAESIHASNHKKVLEMLGVMVETPKTGRIEIKKTEENLEDAIRGETYESDTMYPDYLKVAEAEKVSEAIVSFRYALESEKRHAILYKSALQSLKTNKTGSISTTWYVCPTCGNTYDLEGVKISCEFCGTLKPRFLVF